MAKKKFIERRRQKCREDRTKSIDARDYRSSVVGLLTEMGVELKHTSADRTRMDIVDLSFLTILHGIERGTS